ncbi:hypothetical protein [Marinobacter sp. BGYM27]|uniref:hypothetical protein n=1 Tax=unclassified Marinobacter TaxID=83889 RepID=UPI0021A4E0AB|nr:hypothetical protein [Marinobacter sp. BGYM27]MDG5500727.1 hypothetical protein [Marinobacter sp. BGYM27]
MRINLAIAMFLLCLVSLSTSAAESLPSATAMSDATEQFMATAASGDISRAYKDLAPYLGVPREAFDASAAEAHTYFRKVFDRAGKPVGKTRVAREKIEDDFYREVWLQKFAEAAIAWEFTFYQATQGWKLVGVSYTTDIESLYRPYSP